MFLQLIRYVQHHWPDTAEAWIDKHFIAYYGLGAPLLGSLDPIVGTTSGSNMGLPISDAQAKNMAITFGTMGWFLPTNGRLPGAPADPRQVPLDMRPDPFWEDEIVSVELTNGERHAFGVDELLTGEYFEFMARQFNDTRYLQQLDYLRTSYHKDPLSPLLRAYERPPIRNVMMFYGINKATDYGVQYQQVKDSKEPKVGPCLRASVPSCVRFVKVEHPALTAPPPSALRIILPGTLARLFIRLWKTKVVSSRLRRAASSWVHQVRASQVMRRFRMCRYRIARLGIMTPRQSTSPR